jgi:N-acetylneuraminic acid mutarotase
LAIPAAPIQGRDDFTWVWTGSEVLIWGGRPGPTTTDDHRVSDGSDGAAFEPATGEWRVLPAALIAGRFAHISTWTGREMLVWGGVSSPDAETRRVDGAAYDPASDTWRTIAPSPIHRDGGAAGVWTGSSWAIVEGLKDEDGSPIDVEGATYDPAADQWTVLPGLRLPASVSGSIAWTGSEVLFVANPDAGPAVGYRLRLGEQAWRPIAAAPFGGLSAGTGIWTGGELVIPVAFVEVDPAGNVSDRLFAYDPATDRWRASSLPPTGARGLSAVWTGRELVFYSGLQPAAGYAPAVDRWLELPPAPGAHGFGYSLWAGDRLITWGGGEGESFLRPSDGAEFVPTR